MSSTTDAVQERTWSHRMCFSQSVRVQPSHAPSWSEVFSLKRLQSLLSWRPLDVSVHFDASRTWDAVFPITSGRDFSRPLPRKESTKQFLHSTACPMQAPEPVSQLLETGHHMVAGKLERTSMRLSSLCSNAFPLISAASVIWTI